MAALFHQSESRSKGVGFESLPLHCPIYTAMHSSTYRHIPLPPHSVRHRRGLGLPTALVESVIFYLEWVGLNSDYIANGTGNDE